LNEKEKFWIKKLNTYIDGYNLTTGGDAGYHRVPWNKGKRLTPLSEEHRQRISASLKGKSLSENHKLKMSESRQGKAHPHVGHIGVAPYSRRNKYALGS
jgi:hypothetical protein